MINMLPNILDQNMATKNHTPSHPSRPHSSRILSIASIKKGHQGGGPGVPNIRKPSFLNYCPSVLAGSVAPLSSSVLVDSEEAACPVKSVPGATSGTSGTSGTNAFACSTSALRNASRLAM